MRFGTPLAAALLAVPPSRRRQPRTLPADFDAEVTRAMRQFEVPGFAVAVVKDGRMVLAMSPLADFSVDYQDLLFTPVPPARRPQGHWGFREYGLPNTAASASRASSVRTTASSESPSTSTREKSR
jgi:hypothetical protein